MAIGYKSLKNTFTIGLFLFDKTVSVASENNAFTPVALDTSPISPSLHNLAVGVLEVLDLNSLNCVLFLGKPIAVIHS